MIVNLKEGSCSLPVSLTWSAAAVHRVGCPHSLVTSLGTFLLGCVSHDRRSPRPGAGALFSCHLPLPAFETRVQVTQSFKPQILHMEREYQFTGPADILCLGRNNETRKVKCFDNSLNSTKHKEFLLIIMIKNPASSSQFLAPREVYMKNMVVAKRMTMSQRKHCRGKHLHTEGTLSEGDPDRTQEG